MEGIATDEQRVLSDKEKKRLEKQNETIVSDFKRMKLENDARKNWDLFYKRNETRFFRDRHWTCREFEQLVDAGDERRVLLEIGCGVGNFIFPLIEENRKFFIYCCDFSSRAVQLVKEDPRYNEERVKAFVCDVTSDR